MIVRQRVLSVSELTSHIKGLLDGDGSLANVWVKGEISNLKWHSSGHLYFSLKDRAATLRCVMFQSRCRALRFRPENGGQAVARGYVSVYERDGLYQLYVQDLFPAGIGVLEMALQELKKRLEREGLFDERRKRPLPRLPRRVGVVTSLNGAAWRDIVTVIRRRYPGMGIVLAPASVQGETAAAEIVAALEKLNRWGQVDVIIVGRGGGSAEDLSAFNTEAVARAIYASRIPVIAAVGHETDYTIADLVADRRAPTPSAAAEMAVPVRTELEREILNLYGRLRRSMFQRVGYLKEKVEHLARSRGLARPQHEIYWRQQYVDGLEQRLVQAWQGNWQEKVRHMELLITRLEAASPLTVLARGYAVCRRASGGTVIRSGREVQAGEKVEVILHRGALQCVVEEVEGELSWQKKAN
ncbi:exodeoxyribonuclease VII large subunit [Thermanaeromonas sp. C210]|uniref:exodeoxyribonuclease VII large subunit n=1 Tax=Thermanaeromonas sp. C210 TaxID=2731925 RepID=UPI00155C7FFA|nr:exodeoxyribonuclease VII large subunit [Thermanaeromonas sp. C210]GFN23326.1 exodeoxyribonuclease 7 large subunit [Thermanaeromonas sp. C210]